MIINGIIGFIVISYILNKLDYSILKNHYLKKQKYDLNICCGDTDNGIINADITHQDVKNFVMVKDIYNLHFKDKQFKNTICSHTMEHVDDPEAFFNELKRVSENVTILIPPLWDYGCMFNFFQHKWQFITLKTRHINTLPNKFKLPYDWYYDNFDQKIF
jgi:SAM-dependent methyltransferase